MTNTNHKINQTPSITPKISIFSRPKTQIKEKKLPVKAKSLHPAKFLDSIGEEEMDESKKNWIK